VFELSRQRQWTTTISEEITKVNLRDNPCRQNCCTSTAGIASHRPRRSSWIAFAEQPFLEMKVVPPERVLPGPVPRARPSPPRLRSRTRLIGCALRGMVPRRALFVLQLRYPETDHGRRRSAPATVDEGSQLAAVRREPQGARRYRARRRPVPSALRRRRSDRQGGKRHTQER
jgi:hypothetical protein